MARVALDKLNKFFEGVHAVRDVSLTIEDKEFMVFVGPSGCGKTTTLRMVAGLEEISSGDVYIGDERVTELPPRDRDIAMVFQNYALYPHMSVFDNMAFGLKMRKFAAAEIQTRRPWSAGRKRRQESTARQRAPPEASGSKRRTVQAPQSPSAHPSFVPVRPRRPRRNSSSARCACRPRSPGN